MIRVLHSVSSYLPVSENWIYPQITRVPNVESRVSCGLLNNLGMFPIRNSALLVDLPPWRWAWGIPRLEYTLVKAVGLGGKGTEARIRRWRPQIIHAHFGMRGWESLELKARLRVPLVTSFYGSDAWMLPKTEPIWRERYQQLFMAGDVFLVEGPAMRQRLQELGCPDKKVRIQRIGASLEALPFVRRNFAAGLKVILVGRFVEKKGLVDGLRACLIARSRGVELTVTVVGDAGVDAGRRIKEELHKLAGEPELSGRVEFTGFVPMEKTRALLAAHNVILTPSKHAGDGDAEGGSPVVLTEAMATGLLCIGTAHCDIPEVILNGKTGFVCAEGDSASLADILCGVAAAPERMGQMTEAGRRHVEENFSLPAQLDKLGKIYESLATNR